MSKISITPDASGSGTFTIVSPNSDSDRTITIPDETGTVHTSGGNLTIPNGGTIGSASDADSITIAANGEATFSQDVQVNDLTVRDGGHVGSVSNATALSIAANGNATFTHDVQVSDMTVRDGGHYGSVSNTTALSIAANGEATFTQDVHVDDLTIRDGGGIGSVSDPDAISIASNGDVNMDKTLEVAWGQYSPAIYIGDNAYKIHVDSGKLYIQNNINGVELSQNATSWGAVSDERKKDIIENIENGLTKVNSLRAVIGKYKVEETYDDDVLYSEAEWKPSGKSTGDVKYAKGSAKVGDDVGVRRSFLIAQDVEKVFPEAVDSSNEDNLALRYTDIIPLLVASIKELKVKVESLEAEITTLKGGG